MSRDVVAVTLKDVDPVEQADAEWDPDDPLSILGLRISVQWAGGRTYDGVVHTAYMLPSQAAVSSPDAKVPSNALPGQHLIHYDDGDKRTYFMVEKTWAFLPPEGAPSSTALHWFIGTKSQAGKRLAEEEFFPYVSKDPTAQTNATFNVLVDEKYADHAYTVRTSTNQVVPLAPSAASAAIHTGEVQLPFAPNESEPRGVFEYYFVMNDNEVEGGRRRRPTSCLSHYYALFTKNHQNPNHRPYKKPKMREAMLTFVRIEYERLLTAQIPPADFFERFHCLHQCFDRATRLHAEHVFDELLPTLPEHRESRAIAVLALLNIVGAYGLTSHEIAAENAKDDDSWTYYSSKKKKKEPKVAPPAAKYAWHVLEHLPIREIYAMDLKGLLGPHFLRAIIGLREVAERTSADSYRWLTIVPLLEQHNQLPQAQTPKKESYMEHVAEIAARSMSLHGEMLEARAAEEKEFVPTPEQKEFKPSGEVESLANLSIAFLRNLLRYCPDIGTMAELFDVGVMRQRAEELAQDVADRLGAFHWTEPSQLECLSGLISSVEPLQSPKLAVTILRNQTCAADKLADAALAVVAQCLAHGGSDQAASAAKDFIRTKHNKQPEEKKDDKKDDSVFSWMTGSSSKNKKNKKKQEIDPAELAQKRVEGLRAGVVTVNALLQIPFFQEGSNPKGILFELSRCWFLKGAPDLVLQAICKLGKLVEEVSEHIANFFTSHGVKILEEVAPTVVRSEKELTALIDVIDSELPKRSQTRHTYLFSLARAASGPALDLPSILNNSLMWRQLFTSCGRTWGDYESPLNDMLGNVHGELKATATSISDSSVVLRRLHTVLQSSKPFLDLLQLLGIGVLTPHTLDARAQKLRLFDQTLAEVQCYVNFYCSCGVRIDVQALRSRMADLRERYDNLRLGEISDIFTDMLAPYGGAITWLFHLRNSALFLQLWRQVGNELTQPIEVKRDVDPNLAENVEKLERKMEELQQMLVDQGMQHQENQQQRQQLQQQFMQMQQMQQQLQQQQQQDNNEERQQQVNALQEQINNVQQQLNQRNQQWQQRQQMIGMLQEHYQKMSAEHEQLVADEKQQRDLQMFVEVTLDQDRVVADLIPGVRAQWRSLWRSVEDRSISIDRLQQTFAALKSNAECLSELRTLAMTGDGRYDATQRDAAWVDVSAQKMKDFLLLARLRKWLPALLRCRELLKSLFSSTVEEDDYYKRICELLEAHRKQWNEQTLDSVSRLVAPVKVEIGEDFSSNQLDFLALFCENADLVDWLLAHNQTDEFNRLLQVCRPCTDEPRLLSSIASLVHVRTMLIQALYTKPPYSGLDAFVKTFQQRVNVGSDDISHLENILASFEGLVDVFEKQTRSPGIKSCYEVRDISQKGWFVLRAHPDEAQVLFLEIGEGDAMRQEPLEYLLDLRSKLMMTEIPEELEEELGINRLVESFIIQLQVFTEMRDEVYHLFTSGHFAYQEGFVQRHRFTADGLPRLQGELAKLREHVTEWRMLVTRTREQHYFINYFSMREILRLTRLLTEAAKSPEEREAELKQQQQQQEDKEKHDADGNDGDDEKSAAVAAPAPRPESWSCVQCTFVNPIVSANCQMCNGPRPLEFADDKSNNAADDAAAAAKASVVSELLLQQGEYHEEDPFTELVAMMHLASSHVDPAAVRAAIADWKAATESPDNDKSPRYLLSSLGSILGRTPLQCRAIPPPGPEAHNRADMLITVESETRSLPVWVACAESERHVIDVVLSVYVRRARLPEPGEVVFCTTSTRLEDIELLFWRFLMAKHHQRGDFVFCVADVHQLSYTMQTNVAEKLRELLGVYGTDSAASLLFVSGRQRQVILNAFSAQRVELPPLDDETLKSACKRAFALHCGSTETVSSNINGGGKTHFVMKTVSERQKLGEPFAYRRIPFRESSSAASLVSALGRLSASGKGLNAFHLDIGHIIPANANTVLFELLVMGVIKNAQTCHVYYRRPADVFYLEIPNTPKEKTAEALRFLTLFPANRLEVCGEQLDLRRPIFTDAECTRISNPEYTEMQYVCKYIRAFEAGKFFPGGSFDPEYDPWIDAEIEPEECFKLLAKYCAVDGNPSFLVFSSFVTFLYTGFNGMQNFFVFQPVVLQNNQGMESLKHVFCNLLIETVKDFSLRAVPRGHQFGVLVKKRKAFVPAAVKQMLEQQAAQRQQQLQQQQQQMQQQGIIFQNANEVNLDDGDNTGDDSGGDDNGLPPPPQPVLERVPSAEYREEAQQLAPPPLLREISEEQVSRFAEMTTWEDTEHPVVLFYQSPRGQEVDGMDILSLNPKFVDRYIDQQMKMALEANHIDLEKDWKDLKSETGIQILRKVEGFAGMAAQLPVPEVNAGYVITIDNLLKMLSIQLRMKNNLPVVIMGETGCGKSSLIQQLCAIIRAPLRTLNIHGGMDDTDIMSWMTIVCAEACRHPRERIVVFLDEVNTCNCMGLFKEMVCDRSMNGVILPTNIKLIAACNPYRLKKKAAREEERMAGLIFDHHAQSLGENVGTGIKDPLKNLVYRVHPLPESMIDYVFDFGALAPETERLYIKAMLRSQLSMYVSDEKEVEPSSSEQKRDGGRGGAFDEEEEDEEQHDDDDDNNEDDGAEAAAPEQTPEALAAELGMDNVDELRRHAEQQRVQEELLKKRDSSKKLSAFGEFVEVFAEFICCAQEFVRTVHGGERSVVSLRDVHRCLNVYHWFGEHLSAASDEHVSWTLEDFFAVKECARGQVRQAVILSLAYCYHARLPRDQRRQFCKHLEDTYVHLQQPLEDDSKDKKKKNVSYGDDDDDDDYDGDDGNRGGGGLFGFGRARRRRGRRGQPPARGGFGRFGIFDQAFGTSWEALNTGPKYGPRCVWFKMDVQMFDQTLRQVQELFVRQMNLPKGIALNEALRENLFMILISVLNRIPIFVIGKPGSSKSLAMGLIQSNLNGDASDNRFLRQLPAVEVFSYQCSPLSTSQGIMQAFEAADRYMQQAQNTLAVVLLDEVGLAEQSPHLPLKVLHKVLDEKGGKQAVVGISNWALDPAKMNRAVHLYRPAPTVEDLSVTAEGMVAVPSLKGYLQALARAYSTVYHSQQQEDFWGLREFYSTVRHINRALEASNQALDSRIVMDAVLRNFGGRPQEMPHILDKFFGNIGLSMENVAQQNVVELVQENLNSTEARHLMLLTENNAALGLLFDNRILRHERTEVIFGSDFPLDKTDLQICLNIQRIKLCMAEGITVVLVHCEALYESLYDLLNQHYTEYGGQLYVRLAFGTHSRLCPMHRNFRVVVVVEKTEAYTRLAPPLLNRFEKQVMERHHLLTNRHKQLVDRLQSFTESFGSSLKSLRSSFCGFHSGTLASLAQSIAASDDNDDDDAKAVVSAADENTIDSQFQEAVRRLLWCAVPEAVCRVMGSPERNNALQEKHFVELADVYFRDQYHDDLPSFAEHCLNDWSDEMGAQVVCMTFSPFNLDVGKSLGREGVTHTVLHELSSERDLSQQVDDFFANATDGDVLFVQCDPLAASLRRIEHARYICENSRARHKAQLVAGGRAAKREASHTLEDDEKKQLPPDEEKKVPAADSTAFERDTSSPNKLEKGIHVLLLIHLPRSELAFNFDFDLRWRYAFVDSTVSAQATGLPDIQSMLGQSMTDIMAGLDLRQMLLKNFRSSMTRLVYLHERTNEDVRRQIMFLLQLLQTDEGVSFVEMIRNVVGEMVSESEVSLDIMETARQEHELALAGTFQAALHRKIYETVSAYFAVALAHIDRNSGLFLVPADGKAADADQQLFSYLFRRSWTDMNVFMRCKNAKAVEVPSDGRGGQAFQSRFPFSFFMSRIIESLRGSCQGSSHVEETAQRLFSMVDLEQGLTGVLDESLMRKYVYDFAAMHTVATHHVSKDAQSEMLWNALTLYAGESPRLLASVHARYWQCEQQLHAYYELIEAVPSAIEPVRELLANGADALDSNTDLHVIRHVIEGLDPQRQGWTRVNEYADWMHNFEQAYVHIEAILTRASERLGANVEPQPAQPGSYPAAKQQRQRQGDDDGEEDAVVVEAEDEEEDDDEKSSDAFVAPVAAVHAVDGVLLTEMRKAYERLLFYFTFIRDVSVGLRLSPDLTIETLGELAGTSLRTQGTFRVLVRMLSDLNRKYSRMGQDVECDICCSIPQDPVRSCEQCRRMVCRKCIEEYMNSKNYKQAKRCFYCQATKTRMIVIDEHDRFLVQDSRAKEARLLQVARRFMEFYIMEFCFSKSATDRVEHELLKDFIWLLAKRQLEGINEKYFIDVLPPGAGRVSLLRALLDLDDAKVEEEVFLELERSARESGYLDTPLSVCYASVQEDRLPADARVTNVDHLTYRVSSDQDVPVHRVLQSIATARRVLSREAERLCRDGDGEKKTELYLGDMLDASTSRSLRMFFLKSIERLRGVSFLRAALSQPPLSTSKWLVQWKRDGDTGLLRFMGSNKLPRHNPFLALPGYAGVQQVVSAALVMSGSTQPLESYLLEHQGQPGLKAALLGALFHEAFLLRILDDLPAGIRKKLDELDRWLRSKTGALANWSPAERRLLTGEVLPELTPQSSPEKVALARVTTHVAALALSASRGSFWHSLVCAPRKLVNSYLPCMPEDVTAMAVRVLGGRWYKCPNGHAYYVDQCGRPTVVQKCATCGVDIGGTDHNLLETNQDLDPKLVGNENYSQVTKVEDKSEKNFCLREEKDPFETVRSQPAVAIRALRVLIHAGLTVAQRDVPVQFLNTSYVTAMPEFHKLLEADWAVLKSMVRKPDDDVAILLHECLLQFKPGEAVCAETKQRDEFEGRLVKSITPIFEGEDVVEKLFAKFSSGDDDEAGVFVAELQERFGMGDMDAKVRDESAPALWRYRKPFSQQDFRMELNLNRENQDKYPLLSTFLRDEERLRGLRYIPDVVRWIGLLLSRFNRRIDHASASALTVGQVLQENKGHPEWQAAFEGYKRAWDSSWRFVERFGCMTIPQMYRTIEMNESTPVSFCLPSDKDEGICPLTLARFLGHEHNRFVEGIDEMLLMRGRDMRRSKGSVVSSKFFLESHALRYDLATFIKFVEKQAVRYSGSGQVVFDFEHAEQYLLDRFFHGKPLIDLEVPMMQYSDGVNVGSSMSVVGRKVTQEPLEKEIVEKIRSEIGGNKSKARTALDLLETCVCFLEATGGSVVSKLQVGEMKLADYLEQTLMVEGGFEETKSIARFVRLKHIENLFGILREVTIVDELAAVRPKYKEELEEKQVDALKEAAADMEVGTLLGVLKEFLTGQLTEDHIGADVGLKEVIGYLLVGENNQDSVYLMDLTWFADKFPNWVTCAQAFSVYKCLAEEAQVDSIGRAGNK